MNFIPSRIDTLSADNCEKPNPVVLPPHRDPAAFDMAAVKAVWGERPRCVLTLQWQWVDVAHILGRGEKMGYLKKTPGRELFSSILNFIPLTRDNHKGPQRDKPLMRLMFLDLAAKKVREAVMEGHYQLTDVDRRFVQEIANPWIAEHSTLIVSLPS